MNLTCRPATFDDFPSIYILQQEYFKERQVPKQHNKLSWDVCVDENNKVVGCYSYYDDTTLRQRWYQNFYRAKSRIGTKAVSIMMKYGEEQASKDALDVFFSVEPFNVPWIKQLVQKDFKAIGVIFSKNTKLE